MYKLTLYLLAATILLTSCEEGDTIPAPVIPDISASLTNWEPTVDPTVTALCDPDTSCNLNGCQELYGSDIPFDYKFPVFNPNNSCQFAYYRHDNVQLPGKFQLWVADLCEETYNMISDDAMNDLHWTSDGWIVYARADHYHWRIRPDGTGANLVNPDIGQMNLYLKYSPDSKKYIYQYGVETIIRDTEGNELGRIDPTLGVAYWDWMDNEHLVLLHWTEGGAITNVSRYNTTTEEATLIYSEDLPEGYGNYYRIYLTPERTHVYMMGPGRVEKLDLETGATQLIRSAVHNEIFWGMNVKPDDGRVVLHYAWSEYIWACNVDTHHEFVLFDENYQTGQQIVVE